MRKWLFALILCSVGAQAQLVLPICSPQSPCPGFPLGSVQAGVDQNGWRHFKVTLTQNVTLFSFVGVPPPAQAAINVIFTQDAIGGRTVTFAGNITNPCAILSAANATTLCQFEYDGVAGVFIGVVSGGTPGGSNTQLQFNNSGTFGGLANVAAGSELVSNGASNSPTFQKKQAIDVRDYGADCTDTNDSTTAIANAIAAAGNFGKVIFPANCKVKVSGTTAITLNNVLGLEIEMLGRQGNSCNQGGGGLDYQQTYAAGNTVLYVLDSQRLRIRNLVIYVNGNGDNGLKVDQDVIGPNITTDNIFEGLCIYNNTATRNASFNGVLVSPVSTSNVENQRFRDLMVTCSNSAPTSGTSNGNAWSLPQNSNALNEQIDYLNVINCSKSVNAPGGEVAVSHVTQSDANATGIVLPSINTSIQWARFETQNIALQQTSGSVLGPTLIMSNEFDSTTTPLDCTTNGCGPLTTMISNMTDSQPANWFNFHGNNSASGLFAVNNRNFAWVPSDWNSGGFVFPDFSIGQGLPISTLTLPFRLAPRLKAAGFNSNFGSPYIDLQSNSGGTPQIDDYYIQNMPAGPFGGVTASTLVFGHSPSNGVTPWFSFQGTVSGVNTSAISTPANLVVTNFCSGGAATWTYLAVAHDGTGTTAGSATASTTTGCATLSSSNGNKIAVPSVAGCTFFDIYRTVSGGTPNTTGKIGQLPCYNVGILNVASNDSASANTFFDTGLAGDSTVAPVTNTTGLWSFGVGIKATGTAATLTGTGACSTRSGQLGGSWAGQVTCTAATAASTLTITPGTTAANGWSCWANDVTHTLPGSQSATSTTAPIISFTSVTASDVITFGCVAY